MGCGSSRTTVTAVTTSHNEKWELLRDRLIYSKSASDNRRREEVWKKIDKDKSGTVNYPELERGVIKELKLDEILQKKQLYPVLVRAYNAARAKRLAEQKRLEEEGIDAAGGISGLVEDDDGFMLDDQLNMSGRSALHQSFAMGASGRSATRSNSPVSPTGAAQRRALSPHAIAANQSKTFERSVNNDRQQFTSSTTNKNVGFSVSVATADRNSNSNNNRMNNSTSGGDSPLRRRNGNTNSPKQQPVAVGGADAVDFGLGLSNGGANNNNNNNFFLMGGLGGSSNGRSTSPAQQQIPRSKSPSYGLGGGGGGGGGIPARSKSPSYQRGGVTPTHNALMLFAPPPRSVSRSASPVGGVGGASINRNPLMGQPPNSTPRSTNLFAASTSMSRGATAAAGGGGSPQNMLGGGAGLLNPGNMSPHQQQIRKEKSNYLRREEFRLFLMYVGDYMELYFYFEQIDTSGDKKVTLKEFTAAIPLLEGWGLVIGGSPSELFALLDVSGNNSLTFKEFSDWACKEHLVIVQ